MNYQIFAQLYDEMMDQTLYQQWQNFVKKFVPLDSGSNLLELACGTGILSVDLSRAGYQVTGLDLSEEMLTLASQRALEEEVEIQWLQGDMLDLSEIGYYQTVTCFSDSICYMPDKDSVQRVFEQVYAVLEVGGQFLFDVHSLFQMNTIFPDYCYNYQDADKAFLWHSFVGETENSIEHELTFFIYEEESDAYVRMSELHKEKTYELAVYQQMLKHAGFKNVQVFADFGEKLVDDESPRWFFVAEK